MFLPSVLSCKLGNRLRTVSRTGRALTEPQLRDFLQSVPCFPAVPLPLPFSPACSWKCLVASCPGGRPLPSAHLRSLRSHAETLSLELRRRWVSLILSNKLLGALLWLKTVGKIPPALRLDERRKKLPAGTRPRPAEAAPVAAPRGSAWLCPVLTERGRGRRVTYVSAVGQLHGMTTFFSSHWKGSPGPGPLT